MLNDLLRNVEYLNLSSFFSFLLSYAVTFWYELLVVHAHVYIYSIIISPFTVNKIHLFWCLLNICSVKHSAPFHLSSCVRTLPYALDRASLRFHIYAASRPFLTSSFLRLLLQFFILFYFSPASGTVLVQAYPSLLSSVLHGISFIWNFPRQVLGKQSCNEMGLNCPPHKTHCPSWGGTLALKALFLGPRRLHFFACYTLTSQPVSKM